MRTPKSRNKRVAKISCNKVANHSARSCVQTSLRSVCTHDLGQDSPIQTSSSVNKS